MPNSAKPTAAATPVTRRTLLQRVNRRLATQGEKLVACRVPERHRDYGCFYVRQLDNNVLVSDIGVDLEAVAKVHDALAPDEYVTE